MAGLSLVDLQDRGSFESRLARKLGRLGQEQFSRLKDQLGDPPDLNNLPPQFWTNASEELRALFQTALTEVYMESIQQLLSSQSVGIDVAVVNERAARWAREYSYDLVRGITDKTRAALQQQIAGFFTDKRTLGDLYSSLSPLFGPVRAEMIAVTETTRAQVQGEIAFADELGKLGLRTTQVWQTNNDDLVCPLCGPRNQQRQGEGWNDPPPLHPRCRCFLSAVVIREEVRQ